jgi:hypothetical protein
MSRPTFEKSLDTTALETLLRDAKVGELIPYTRLSKAIGRDVRIQPGYGALSTARKSLLTEQIRFATMRGDGLQRMTDKEVALSGPAEVRGVHRRAAVGLKRVAAVQDFDGLPNDAKVKHNVSAAQLGVLAHVSDSRRAARIQNQVQSSEAWKPTREAIGLLVSGLSKKKG